MVTAVYGRDGGISVDGSGRTMIGIGSKEEMGCEKGDVIARVCTFVRVSAISISFQGAHSRMQPPQVNQNSRLCTKTLTENLKWRIQRLQGVNL
jgi:hypothetical protein